MMSNEEKELQEQLKKETDVATELKKDTWLTIENDLFGKQKKRSWISRIAVGVGTVAAAVLLIIISTSLLTSDQAGEQEQPEEPNEQQPKDPKEQQPSNEVDVPLEDQYEKEIQRERELEGQLEIVDLTLAVNEDDRYIVYVDKERYEFIIDNGEGQINFLADLDDTYPRVGITIEQHTDTTKDELIARVKEEITNEEMMLTREETISYPLDAYAITAYASVDAYEWNSPVYHYYIYEAEKGIYFIFKQMLFMEALDGHNSIFDFMLETFKYVPNE